MWISMHITLENDNMQFSNGKGSLYKKASHCLNSCQWIKCSIGWISLSKKEEELFFLLNGVAILLLIFRPFV